MTYNPTYGFNGSAASIAPTNITWTPIVVGRDHNGMPIYAANWDVTLTFDSASVPFAQQWLSQASGGTSLNLYIPDRWLMKDVILSGVYLELTSPPALTSAHMSGFTLTVRGATASALEVSPGA